MSLKVTARNDLHSSKFVEITVKNTGSSDCHTRNPIHSNGLLKENAVQVADTRGHRVLYTGPALLQDNHETTRLNPNQELSFVVSLSESYALETEGNYFAKYTAHCEENPHDVAVSNTVSISGKDQDILRDAAAGKTLADRKKDGFEGYNHLSPGIKESRYKFLNTNDQTFVEETAKAADESLENLKNITKFQRVKFLEHYNKFICDKNSNGKTNYETHIQEIFNKTLAFIENDDIAFIHRGKYCGPDTNAYVYPAEPLKNIYLCDRFANKLPALPETGSPYYTKLGTLTHEITHKVDSCIVDHYYPIKDCVEHVKKLSCVDTQAMINTLGGSCDENDITDHLTNQSPPKTKYDVNLNMYTANCLRFFAEDAYEPKTMSDNYMTYLAGAGTALALGLGYLRYQQHATNAH